MDTVLPPQGWSEGLGQKKRYREMHYGIAGAFTIGRDKQKCFFFFLVAEIGRAHV